jgi:hypothetical protein
MFVVCLLPNLLEEKDQGQSRSVGCVGDIGKRSGGARKGKEENMEEPSRRYIDVYVYNSI